MHFLLADFSKQVEFVPFMAQPPTPDRWPDWPTLSVIVLVTSTATYGVSLTIADPDLWGHVRFGLDILATGHIVHADPYSYLTGEQPWINHEWLAEVIFAQAFAVGGSEVLIALKTSLALLTLGLVYRHLMRQGLAPLRAGLYMLFCYFLLSKGVALLRPQIFTFLLFALLLLLLDEADRGRLPRLVAVPALFGLWANLHGGFLAGLGILFLWVFVRLAATLRGGRPWRPEGPFVLTAIAALAATLLNPHGARLLMFLVRPATVSRPEIIEWQPIAIASTYGITYLIFVALAAAALLYTRRPRRLTTVVAFACLALIPLLAIRHCPLLAVGAPLLLAEHLSDAWNRWSPSVPAGSQRTPRPLAVLAIIVAIALLWAARPRFGCIRIDPALAIGYPARAVATLRESRVEGNLAIPFGWGEYAIWFLSPRIKVSEDGRRETVYSDAVLADNLRFADGVGNWDALLRDRTDLVLVDKSHAAFNLMKLYPGWVSVYEDSVAAIFTRSGSSMVALIRDALPPTVPANGAGLCFP
jgi:hypothetical protein